ncbi:MAG: leucine-rich repeat protein [Porcipelethomonas sp.]
MKITKKILSAFTAAACAATASVCSLSVSAEIISAEKTSGDLVYVQVDEDDDGIKDFVRITDCSSTAESVLIPKTIDDLQVREIEDDAFDDSTSLISINVDSQNSYFAADDGILFNKNGSKLICFPSAKAATSYNIPAAVKEVGANAFANCAKMSKVTIPSSVTSIGDYAFYNCESLAEIDIPSSVESVGNGAFWGTEILNYQFRNGSGPLYYADSWVIYCDDNVTTVMEGSSPIASGTTGIAGGSFAGCTELTKIDIPTGVFYIGSGAFAGCSSLSSVSIPTTVKTIGSCAFEACSALVELSVPNSVKEIGIAAFYNCSKLAKINIPSSVTTIAESTFESCSALLEINIPSNVTSIQKLAFYNCTNLNKVTINNKSCDIKDAPQTISNSGSSFGGTIYGYEGSTAQSYAKTYNILFESIGSGVGPDKPSVSGDANGDGTLNVRDAAFIAQKLAQGKSSELPLSADFNEDGTVNVRDAASIAQYLATAGKG